MNRDLSVSAFNPEFAFENRNLRLSTNENNTMLSWVNEKGTQEMVLDIEYYDSLGTKQKASNIFGRVIGTAILNRYLVLFSHSNTKDYIYRLESDGGHYMFGKILYSGNLGFDLQHPIETLVSYEAETVQKVYWTDNKNQPRIINVAADDETVLKWNSDSATTVFDFVRTLKLEETVEIKKLVGATGMFPAGVIQYAFTYYDKYGQESNIFYTSPLLYTSHRDRGGSPEDKVDNAFQITIRDVDNGFEFLRIYSILRTSVNGTPICKRVQDIEIGSLPDINFVDTGNIGDTIDPTELLYKGGEEITAGTIEQKDGTIFLGDISIKRTPIEYQAKAWVSSTGIETSYRKFAPTVINKGSYAYANQLTSSYVRSDNTIQSNTVSCSGFKKGDKYRLGLQFQYKTGKWSEPVWVKDETMDKSFTMDTDGTIINAPVFQTTLAPGTTSELLRLGYKKARAVCVYPSVQDRNVLCQGVICPTLYTDNHKNKPDEIHSDYIGDLQAQSSWFFRAQRTEESILNKQKALMPYWIVDTQRGEDLPLYYNSKGADTTLNPRPENIRKAEIQGDFNMPNRFRIGQDHITFHSPDIEFDTQMANIEFEGASCKQVGYAKFIRTLSDIDIQTETPTISGSGAGFVHKSFDCEGMYGIASGAFYDDYIVDDMGETAGIVPYNKEVSPVKWMVYLWNRSGSLNNDMNRPADKGIQTARLKKKIISNLRYSTTIPASSFNSFTPAHIKVFSSDQDTIIKMDEDIYKGNIDSILIPDNPDGAYFIGDNDEGYDYTSKRFSPSFTGEIRYRLQTRDFEESGMSQEDWESWIAHHDSEIHGILHWENSSSGLKWILKTDDLGDDFDGLTSDKSPIKMKYKSTPHLVIKMTNEGKNNLSWDNAYNPAIPVVEIIQNNVTNAFGGNTSDALQANDWLPCGEPVKLSDGSCLVEWSYGDTYYQRWDCLKTYAFTEEDENQVVEIGSFMLETRTNIDGRYDRNRGQSNNLYMSPRNFNLINPVYSQQNNFFTYKILDKSFYENNAFPNQVTWSLTKQSSADVDMWTNVTLANTIEMDGDKGKVNKLIRMNDQLLCFQDTGLSQVMYNENMALTTTEGVPIEIANSGKVQGKRYLSNTVGCSNKWSIVPTPSGIYFMDSHNKSIYMFNGQLNNLSTAAGFNTWCKGNINLTKDGWNPEGFGDFVGYYDKLNQDVLFINSSTALAYSEKIGAFTSFYDYGGASFFCNLDDTGLWIKDYTEPGTTVTNSKIWLHQGGEYCNFFGEQKPYGMLLVGNPEPLTDKIFTNLEFRACVDGEGEFKIVDEGTETEHKEFSGKFFLPFDYLETWNEYQHGVAQLQWKNGDKLKETMRHHLLDNTAHLARKFRIWRCDIPRDNAETVNVFDYTFDDTFHNTRVGARIDRMRNPWLYIKLKKDSDTDKRVEIHDMVMTYYN